MNDDSTPAGEGRGTGPSPTADNGIGEDAQGGPAGYLRASDRRQRAVLALLACAALAVAIWLIWPVGVGIFLGVLLAFTVEPLYQRLVQSHMRPALIALVTVFL